MVISNLRIFIVSAAILCASGSFADRIFIIKKRTEHFLRLNFSGDFHLTRKLTEVAIDLSIENKSEAAMASRSVLDKALEIINAELSSATAELRLVENNIRQITESYDLHPQLDSLRQQRQTILGQINKLNTEKLSVEANRFKDYVLARISPETLAQFADQKTGIVDYPIQDLLNQLGYEALAREEIKKLNFRILLYLPMEPLSPHVDIRTSLSELQSPGKKLDYQGCKDWLSPTAKGL